MKLKNIENILSINGRIDKKCKLNRSNVVIKNEILQKIDNGITCENLDLLIDKKLPVFKYSGQITIHGLFPNFEKNYCFGYKHLVQNKNKSIGIKYGAIDETKRQYLKKPLSYLGFHYVKNSNTNDFVIQKRCFDKNEYLKNINDLKNIAEKINKDLFFGGYRIYSGSYLGVIYSFLELTINSIYEKNIDLFLNDLGLNKEFIDKKIEAEKIEAENRSKQWQIEREIKEAEKNKKTNEAKNLIENFGLKKEIPTENNIYLSFSVGYDNEISFNIIKPLPKGRNKHLRYLKLEYNSIKEAKENVDQINNVSEYSARISKYGLKEMYRLK